MDSSSKKDALGELFRQKLENHEIEVDSLSWDKIESRLGKPKNKPVIQMWHYFAVAAAASVAALLYFNISTEQTPDEPVNIAVSQQIETEANEIDNNETIPTPQTNIAQQTPHQVNITHQTPPQTIIAKQIPLNTNTNNEISVDLCETSVNLSVTKPEPEPDTLYMIAENHHIEDIKDSNLNSQFNDSVDQLISHSVITKLDISLVEDRAEEDENDTEKTGRWLLAAVLGTGTVGYSGNLNETNADYSVIYNDKNYSLEKSTPSNYAYDSFEPNVPILSTDRYAAYQPIKHISKNDFTNIQHRQPFSFGMKVCKELGENIGVESGLVYTFLSSRFEWSGYETNQNLHYIGIPVNFVTFLGNSKSNWRFYFSGGGTLEKGLINVSRQERRLGSEIRKTNNIRSSISGMQWSLNGGFGVNYKLEKGWGIYFEPRMGYSFDSNQPVSIRTEHPLYFGINLGLNYEL